VEFATNIVLLICPLIVGCTAVSKPGVTSLRKYVVLAVKDVKPVRYPACVKSKQLAL
jgi:hypothetical protein